MSRYLVISLIVLTLAGGAYLLPSPYGRHLIDRVRINVERAEHRASYHLGARLRGTPDLARLDMRLAEKGVALGAPIHIRIYKLESELELWTGKNGRFELFATYPICFWSGRLRPKLKEGDLQAPEGFYTVTKGALNPNSKHHRSFNLGFPNVYDRSKGRTGSDLMVHGGCTSVGCYATTWLTRFGASSPQHSIMARHAFPFTHFLSA